MSHKMLNGLKRPIIVNMSVLGYFPLIRECRT